MANWLRYANQGATRNKPLSGKLTNALAFLPELGVEMEVFSGGQDAHGSQRVGSTRHDHGHAADVFFHKDGRRLDWANPDDRPLFEEIVRRGRANGLTGFGAGDNYMQPGSMHLGFGKEAVWGAGGKGENAPDWLKSAYSAKSDTPLSFGPQSSDGGSSDLLSMIDQRSRGGGRSKMETANALASMAPDFDAGEQDVRNFLTEPQPRQSYGYTRETNPFLVG